MLISLFSPLAIGVAGLMFFLFGWLWYSPLLFMRWWLDGKNIVMEDMSKRGTRYSWQVMIYIFFVCIAMSAVLAFVIDVASLETFSQALSLSLVLALGFIGLKNFSDMLYSMPEAFWSIKAQKRFFVDTVFYMFGFVIVTIVLYYMQTWLGR